MRTRVGLLAVGVLLVARAVLLAAEPPVAVSPGSPTGTAIGDTCPTFSWGAVEEAELYELVAYRLGDEGQEAMPVLREKIPGSTLAWTPSLDRCLERGSQYDWSVRAAGRKTLPRRALRAATGGETSATAKSAPLPGPLSMSGRFASDSDRHH